MHPAAHHARVAFGMICLLVGSATASAQTAGYIAGAAFADIRQFGSTSSQPVILTSNTSMDATGAGGSLRIGTWLHPRWTLEVGADVGNRTTVEYQSPVVIAIFPPPTPLKSESSTSFVSVSTMAGFHPPSVGRVRFGYLAGFSFVRATYKSDYPGYPIPAILDFSIDALPSTALTSYISSITSVASRLTRTALTQKQNTGALALGFEAAIDVTRKLSVVPEVRALTFSTPGSGAGVFLIRPGVGVRWKF